MVESENKVILKVNGAADVECGSINEALALIKAADTGAECVIELTGTFSDNVYISGQTIQQNDANVKTVKFVGTEGTTITGGLSVGNWNNSDTVTKFASDVAFEGIDFTIKTTDTHTEAVKVGVIDKAGSVDFTKCSFDVADAEVYQDNLNVFYAPSQKSGRFNLTCNDCTFSDGRVQVQANGNMVFDGCTFDGAPVNVTGGYDGEFKDCTFTADVNELYLDAEGNTGNIYLLRMRGSVKDGNISGCTFNLTNEKGLTPASSEDCWSAVVLRNQNDTGTLTIENSTFAGEALEVEGVHAVANTVNKENVGATDTTISMSGCTGYETNNTLGSLEVVEKNDAGEVLFTTTYTDGEKTKTEVAAGCMIVSDSITAADGEVEINGIEYTVGVNAFASINAALDVIKNATDDAGVKYTIQLDGTFDEAVVLDWAETNDIAFVKAIGSETAEITGKVSVGKMNGRYDTNATWQGNLAFEGITFDYSEIVYDSEGNPDWSNRFNIVHVDQNLKLELTDCKFVGSGVIDGAYNGGKPSDNNGTDPSMGCYDGNLFGTAWGSANYQGEIIVKGCEFENGNINFWRNYNGISFVECSFDNVPVSLLGLQTGANEDYEFVDCKFSLDLSQVDGEYATYLVSATENAKAVKFDGCSMEIIGEADGREVSYVLSLAPNANDNSTKVDIVMDGVKVEGEIPADVEFYTVKSPAETDSNKYTCDTIVSELNGTDIEGITAADLKGAANVTITDTANKVVYTTDDNGDVTTTGSGNKQYAADAVIGEGFSEIYNGSVVVGYSKYVNGLPVAADDGKFEAEVIVEGSLTANGKYLWVGGDTGTAERFGLVVDGGTVANRKGEGTYLRPQGYLEVINGGTFDGCLINASDSRVKVEGSSSEDKSTIYLTSNSLNATNTEVTIGKFGQLIMKEDDPSLGGSATINLKEGSTLKVEKDGYVENTVNNTTIDSDSTFEVAGGTVDLKNVTNEGTFKVTGSDASTVKATITGKALEVASGGLKDSEIAGKVHVTGNAEFEGKVAVTGTHVDVNNGAELTVGKDAEFTNAGFLFAGDGAWGDFGDSGKGGTIKIQGSVKTDQTNANAGGAVVVDGGKLDSPIVVLENGEIENRKSGSMTIQNGGKVTSAQFNVRYEDSALTISGEGSELKMTNSVGGGTLVHFNNSGTTVIKEGGSLVYDLAESYGVPAESVTNNGTLTVNGGNVTVNSAVSITNNGTFKVTGSDASTVKATITGKALELAGTLDKSNVDGKIKVVGNGTIQSSKVGTVYVGINQNLDASASTGYFEAGYSDKANTLTIKENVTSGRLYIGCSNDAAATAKVYIEKEANVNVTGSYIYASGELHVKGNITSSQDVSVGGKMYLTEGATWTQNWEGRITKNGVLSLNDSSATLAGYWYVGGYYESSTGGTIQLANGASIKFTGNLTTQKESNITINDSSFTANILNHSGDITMDAASSITAGSITGDGVITIDANGFDGVKKVVDITGAGQKWAEGQLVFKNLGETLVAYGADGDVVLANVDAKTLYVDSKWADSDPETTGNQAYEIGDEVAEGKYYGFNAFATSKDALEKANELGGAVIDIDGMTADESNYFAITNSGDYTITGGNGELFTRLVVTGKNINLTFEDAYFRLAWCYRTDETSTFTVKNSVIGKAPHSNSAPWFTAKHTSSLIKDSIYGINLDNYTDEQISVMARSASELKVAIEAGTQTYVPCGNNNSGHHVGTAADLTIEDSTFFSGWISVIDRAIVELDNSVLYYGASISIGAARVDGISDVNLNGWDAQTSKWFSGTPLASADGFREGEIATMNVTDSIVRNVLWGNGNAGGGIIQVGGSYVHDNGYAGECAGVLNITRSDFSTTPVNDKGEVVETSNSDIVVVKHNGTVNVIDSKFTSGKVEIETVAATETEPAKSGEFIVKGASQLIVDAVSGNAIKLDNGAVLTDSKIYSADYTKGGAEVWVAGNVVMNGTYEGNLTRVSGANAKLTINGTYTATNGGYYQLTVGGTSNWHMDRYYNGSYADGGALVVSKDASVTVDCLSIVANGSASIAGNVTVDSQFELSNGGISNAQAGKLTVEKGATLKGAVYTHIYGVLTVNGSYVVSPIAELAPDFMVHEGGVVNVVNGSLVIDKVVANNAGTITISGESTVNATVTGKGAVVLDWWATLGGDLKLTGDAALKLNGYASLADDAAIDGKLVDGVLMVKGSGNTITLADDTTTVLQLADGTVLDAATDKLAGAKIQGEWWGVTFTVDDAVLAGNTVAAGAFMNITNADDSIKVDADITQIKTINGFAVEKLGEMYYYVDGEGVTNLITATSSGFDISKKVKPDDDVTPGTDPVATGLNSIYVAEETTALANSNIEMAAGYTNIVTGSGAWSEDKTNNMDVAFGSIQKDSDKGGINEIYVGSNVDMDINGNVDSMGSASVGANSSLDVRDNVNGQNNGQSIYVGYNADMTVGKDMDLKGGWNSLSVDYKGDLDVEGSVKNVASLGIYSGVEDKKATIGGDFIAPLYNSNINVGYMSSLSIKGDIVNGVPAAVYECLGTGTYISVGYDAAFSARDIYGLSGMYADAESVVTVGNIYGTMYGNGIYAGGDEFNAGNIDLKGGWNSFATGYKTKAEVNDIKNVASISTGWAANTTVDGVITGVQSLNVAGNWGSKVDFSVAGAVTAADWAYFYVGSYVEADFEAGITFGTTWDTIDIGSYSDVDVTGSITNVDSVYVGWGSSMDVTGNITGVQSLNVAGNWDARVSFSAADITTADWSYVGIGSFVDAKIGNITFGTTWDTMNIGYKSTVEIGTGAAVDFSNLDALYADGTAMLKVNNGKGNDVDLSKVGGWWQDATILDEEGALAAAGTENAGSVYANEWDVYSIDSSVTQVKFDSSTAGIKYEISEDGGVNWREYNLTDSNKNVIAADADNLVRVGVTTGFDDETKKASYSFELLA